MQGGTLDVTAHEILPDETIKEIYHVTGGPYGGIYVDEKFVSLLESIFGARIVKNYRIRYPADWLRLLNDFEIKKRGRRAFHDKTTRIILPRNFIELVSDAKTSDFTERFARSCNLHDVEIYQDEFLCLGPTAMKQLFQPVINGIVSHMRGLFSSPALKNVSCLFMVGGFAESVILQEAIKTAFSSRCKILVPNYAGIAVVQGATMFGQKPAVVSSRIMATTYGFRGYGRFNPNVHPPDKKHVVEGVAKCKDLFFVIVNENDVVKVGETKRFIRTPTYSDQTVITLAFFTSTDPNAKYTTDPTVGQSIGKVVVKSPDTSQGKKRKIEVCILFGGTEIKVTAIDKTSGNTATAYLDFLCKP